MSFSSKTSGLSSVQNHLKLKPLRSIKYFVLDYGQCILKLYIGVFYCNSWEIST